MKFRRAIWATRVSCWY